MNWTSRLAALFRKRELDTELDDELRFHLEMETQQNIRNGMPQAEARRQARLRLGGFEQVKENYRDRRGIPLIESLLQDIRFALRSFRKYPGFTIAALVTLALSIGIGTAIFSIVHALLFEPPPYGEPERLVMVWSTNEEKGVDLATARRRGKSMGLQEVMDWKRDSSVFESMVAWEGWRMPVMGPGEPEELFVYAVSDGFLETAGVQPVLGRGFRPEETKPGGKHQVLLLSHDYWQRSFNSDPGVLGKEFRVGGAMGRREIQPYTVIGVLPPGFKFDKRNAKAFVPLSWGMDQRTRRGQKVMARLKPGATLKQSQAGANLFSKELERKHPEANTGWSVNLVPVKEDSSASLRPILQILFAAVAFVIFIACSNVAALLMIKLSERSRELALRCVLGASRTRVMRQVLTENLALSGTGGLIGLGLAWLIIRYIHSLNLGDRLIGVETIAINPPVAAFALIATISSALLFGLLPAWKASTVAPNASLADAAYGSTAGVRGRWLRDVVVALQVSLAVVFVVAAALLTTSFARLANRDLGFETANLLRVSMPRVHFEEMARLRRDTSSDEEFGAAQQRWLSNANQAVVETVRAIPGVESVGIGSFFVGNDSSLAPVNIKGQPSERESDAPRAYWGVASGDCFRTLKVPLLRGRMFDEFDSPSSTPVAVVNEALADHLWPNEDPTGRELTAWGQMTFTVVGVIGNVRHTGIRNPEAPAFFWNASQSPNKNLGLVVRSNRTPGDLVPEIRQLAAEVDPTLVFRGATTVDDILTRTEWQLQYSVLLLGGLSLAALVLALVSVYGTLNHVVGRRTREIGLRMALGADRVDVLRMVIRQGLIVAGAGVTAGLFGAAGVTRFLQSLLFGVQPVDGETFTAVSAGILVAAAFASYLPARRAAKVDPMVALRYE